MGWIAASEDRVRVESRAIIPGQLVAPPPEYGPAGLVHAVDADAPHATACGHSTRGMYFDPEPIPWERTYLGMDRCPDCTAIVNVEPG